MSPKTKHRPVGPTALGLLGIAALVAAAGEGPPAAPGTTSAPAVSAAPVPSQTVLLLLNGRLIQGSIGEEGEYFILHAKGGSIRFHKSQVEGKFASLVEVYAYKRTLFSDRDPDEHLKLARWCLSHDLRVEAKRELAAVARLTPKSGEAKAMLASIEATELRVAEARVRVDASVRQTGADGSSMVGPGGRVDRPEELDPSLLKRWRTELGVSGLPVIFDLPPVMAVQRAGEYARVVHPILQATCVQCHDERHDRELQFVAVKTRRQLTPDVLRANLDATLKYVDKDNPAKSELLSTTLLPHGPSRKPIFKGSNDPRFQILSTWVSKLKPVNNRAGEAVDRARFAGVTDGPERATGGGFASERGLVPLPFSPTPGGTKPGEILPGNVRHEVLSTPPAVFVPGRGMVAEKQPPSADDFPLPLAAGGSGRSPSAPGTPKPGSKLPRPDAPAADAGTPPGLLPELPLTPEESPPEALPKDAQSAKSPKPKKLFKIDTEALERALLNRNSGR